MRIAKEPLQQWLREAAPMLEAHWREVAPNQDKMALNPDFQKYYTLEASRLLHSYTLRDDAGKLVGYAVFLVSPTMHFRDHQLAYNDSIYVDLSRGRGFAPWLIRFAERDLKALGVSKVVIQATTTNRFGELLDRMDYGLEATVHSKMLI